MRPGESVCNTEYEIEKDYEQVRMKCKSENYALSSPEPSAFAKLMVQLHILKFFKIILII